jgi:nitrite reductase/ring-hydroxylating ferredoxin subunit
MLVLTFSVAGRNNCVMVAGTPYVYARTRIGSFLLPARCPHRGGPLHLATFEPTGTRLICPWHGRATSVTRAMSTGIPVTRRGNVVTAVFPHPVSTDHRTEHRPVSPELASPSTRDDRVSA